MAAPTERRTRLLAGSLLLALLLPLAGCNDGDGDESSDSTTTTVDEEVFPDIRCGPPEGCDEFYTDEQKAVIEDYVDAWNAQDLDAIEQLLSLDEWMPGDPMCAHDVTLRAGLTLAVDFDGCRYALVDSDGERVETANPTCMLGWVGFDFDEDGQGLLLRATPVPNEVVFWGESTGVLDDDALAELDRDCATVESDQ